MLFIKINLNVKLEKIKEKKILKHNQFPKNNRKNYKNTQIIKNA